MNFADLISKVKSSFSPNEDSYQGGQIASYSKKPSLFFRDAITGAGEIGKSIGGLFRGNPQDQYSSPLPTTSPTMVPTMAPTSTPTPMDSYQGLSQIKPPEDISNLVLQASQQYGIPPALLAAILWQESGYKPDAVNENYDEEGNLTGYDRGVAQINSSAHPNVTEEQAYDPSFAIPYAAQILSKDKEYFNDWNKAIAAYNVGRGGVENNLGQDTPFGGGPKGQAYINKVSKNLDEDYIQELGLLLNSLGLA